MQNIPAYLLMGIDLKILIPRSIGTVEPLIINTPSSQQQTISYERLLGSRIVTSPCHRQHMAAAQAAAFAPLEQETTGSIIG